MRSVENRGKAWKRGKALQKRGSVERHRGKRGNVPRYLIANKLTPKTAQKRPFL